MNRLNVVTSVSLSLLVAAACASGASDTPDAPQQTESATSPGAQQGAPATSPASSGDGDRRRADAAVPVDASEAGSTTPVPTGTLKTIFVIVLENHNWSGIKGSASAPYINNTLLRDGAHCEQYFNMPGMHPSEPNYIVMEAGDALGIKNDSPPASNHRSAPHLSMQLDAAGIAWRSYQEDITGTVCPVTNVGLYAPKHNPFVFFDDVTANTANCVAHNRPMTELASDLRTNSVARYNFLTPNLCNDMHGASGCPHDSIKTGDDWLAATIPAIQASAAYRNGGAIFVTFDESEGGDFPIGMIALSALAKPGFSSSVAHTHSALLRSVQDVFGVRPYLGDAAHASNLGELFTSFP